MSLARLPFLARSIGALCLAQAAPLFAQSPPAPSQPRSGPIIREIRIERSNIFDSTSDKGWLYKGMNNLHIVTKPYVIQEQLLFKVGDRWDTAVVNETARNLRALNIFTSVEIDSIPTDSGLVARVHTIDAWTLGIVFSINTSGSQIAYAVGFNSKNVLGTGTQMQLQYGKNPTRDSILVGLTRRLAFSTPYDFGLLLSKLSDGANDTISFGLPFRTLESPNGWTLLGRVRNGRILQYVGGDTTASDTLRQSYQLLSVNPAIALHATDDSYIRLGFFAQVVRYDTVQYSLPTSALATNITSAFGPYLAVGYPKFHHVRYYQAGGRTEDLQLGITGTVGLYVAPAAWGYGSTGIGPTVTLSAGQGSPHAFLLETVTATSLYQSRALDSGTVNAGVTAAWFPEPQQMLIAYAGGGMQRNVAVGEEFQLGFGYGARAYPQYAFTGDRMFITSAEYRWIIWPNLYKIVAVGVAAFVDHAGAWFDGSPQRAGTDFGVGLRLGARTGTAGYLMRADLAYRMANDQVPAGWVFTFGKGFVWQQFF